MNALPRIGIGFKPKNLALYRTYNFILSAMLLILVFPLLIMISTALIITQGPAIFYRAERLGKDQNFFKIIKFRTLCSKRAQELTKDRTLPVGSNIETPLGGLLRDTRLDELPQLVNVLFGQMNLCGPRPVRAEIANIERDRIPGYDMRFEVKPGLVGPTQAYFGHGTSKRLRARMNNRNVRRTVSIRAELILLGQIASSMIARASRKAVNSALKSSKRNLHLSRRVMWLEHDEGRSISPVEKIDGHEVVAPGLHMSPFDDTATLCVRLKSGGLRKARLKLCSTEKPETFGYMAATDLGEFVVERYALDRVVVLPQVSQWQHASGMINVMNREEQAREKNVFL